MRQRFYRRRAIFVRNPRDFSTPLDRNERARLLFLAESMEQRTKSPGRKNGALGAVGLEVLRALLKRMNYANFASPDDVNNDAVSDASLPLRRARQKAVLIGPLLYVRLLVGVLSLLPRCQDVLRASPS